MSKIATIPVTNLAKTSPDEREKFLIPDYQRGYRWGEIQVETLLNDLYDFMEHGGGSTYCLQPIVVTKSDDENYPTAWEVIDGQQRLTTLYLLLKALKKDTFELVYAQRYNAMFLNNPVEGGKKREDNPDFYYMSKAWDSINKWIDNHNGENNDFCQKFTDVLQKVIVIWYDVGVTDKNDKIEIFNRLNIGKIPLTNAELVKALLLSKIKGSPAPSQELALRQAEISMGMHDMETDLSQSEKWRFLGEPEADSHLDCVLDLVVPEDSVYSTYLWFEQEINTAANNPLERAKKAGELWGRIKEANSRLNALFCENTQNSTVYHYAGYLMAIGKKTSTDICRKAEGKSHRALQDRLYSEIKLHLLKALKNAKAIYEAINIDNLSIDGDIDKIIRMSIDKDKMDLSQIGYDSNYKLCKEILFLFNVLYYENFKDKYRRFPFNRYLKEKWSLEHIYPQNPESTNDMDQWIKDALDILRDIDVIQSDNSNENLSAADLDSLKQQLQQMQTSGLSSSKKEEFKNLRKQLTDWFNQAPSHDLGNLALLPSEINSSLNNAIFPVKRMRILDYESPERHAKNRRPRFIPPCTRNVFLKVYSPPFSQPYFWGPEDHDAYLEAISSTLLDFINQGNQHE